MPNTIISHDVLEPLKQVLSASRDVIVLGQICGSKLQRVFTSGDGCWLSKSAISNRTMFGNGPNTVSGSTVSNTELSEFFGAHRVSGSELSGFLSAYHLCVNANSPEFVAELTEFAAELSEAQ